MQEKYSAIFDSEMKGSFVSHQAFIRYQCLGVFTGALFSSTVTAAQPTTLLSTLMTTEKRIPVSPSFYWLHWLYRALALDTCYDVVGVHMPWTGCVFTRFTCTRERGSLIVQLVGITAASDMSRDAVVAFT